jgi:hypothetical protein
VVHKTHGTGTVRAYEGERRDKLVLEFERSGSRQLSVASVTDSGLLRKTAQPR